MLRAVSLLLALAPLAAAQDVRVLTLDASRAHVCGSANFGLLTGNTHTTAIGWLGDPGRFGPAGTFPRGVDFVPSVPMLDPVTLATADVVLLGLNSPPLLRCEIAELVEFVRQGGGVFSFSNSAALDFTEALGAVGGDPGAGAAVVVDPASPVANGPFGTVTGSIGGLQFHRVLTDVGPFGNAVVDTTGTFIAEFQIGSGRLVTAGDEEWIMDTTFGGCAAAQLPNTPRQTLFLNAFASVIPAAGFQYSANPQTIGATYCGPANFNSRGLAATTCAFGSDVVADNDVTLATDWLPANRFGFYVTSPVQGFVVAPGGSQGNLCLAHPIGRFNQATAIQNSGPGGFFTLSVDLSSLPRPMGPAAVLPGETHHFQAWYRDFNPTATSNFSNAVTITFL